MLQMRLLWCHTYVNSMHFLIQFLMKTTERTFQIQLAMEIMLL